MKGGLILHVNHISGKRIPECGVDTLSRGNTTEGVMTGKQLMCYLPLYLSALDRSQGLTK